MMRIIICGEQGEAGCLHIFPSSRSLMANASSAFLTGKYVPEVKARDLHRKPKKDTRDLPPDEGSDQ
jgi:hypothetical protein